MQLTVHELAALVGGQFASEADGAAKIGGATSIAEAREGDVTFFGNVKYLAALKACHATAALVPMDFAEAIPPIAIRCENPTLAFSTVLARIAPPPIRFPSGVHPSAIIGAGVELGADVSIQPHVVIEPGAKVGARTVLGAGSYIGHDAQLGEDCQLAARVTVGARCVVGNRAIFHSGVVIGSDGFGFEFTAGRHVKIPQTGIVQVDDDVEIGANTTVDRARFGRTWIGEGTKIDNLVQLGHNVQIGRHCIVCAQTGISGSARLGNFVVVGGQVGTVGHIFIGDGAQIGAQSGITKDVPPGAVLWGTPAIPIKEQIDLLARFSRLPRLGERVKRLEQMARESGKTLPSGE
ncbi:MAG: UDP-3-O-(3-hydroxymyristoyl)glucosamine N-acyltransferase [Chthoniobacteraceae bacterium]